MRLRAHDLAVVVMGVAVVDLAVGVAVVLELVLVLEREVLGVTAAHGRNGLNGRLAAGLGAFFEDGVG